MTTNADDIDVTTLADRFTPGSVVVDPFVVEYFAAGDGDPLVVLHGAGGPEFSIALARLAQRFRVVLLQIPGFGDQVNDVHQSLEELADAIAHAVAAMGIERYHLLGTSFGGAVAACLAIAHPDRLLSLVLDAPALFRVDAVPPAPDSDPSELAARFRANPDREPRFSQPVPTANAQQWPFVEKLLSSRAEYDTGIAEKLQNCSVRTLVVFGDRDGIIPPSNGRIYRRIMPNCALIYLYGAAHAAQFDRPEAFSDVVGDFLERGWEFLIPHESTMINP